MAQPNEITINDIMYDIESIFQTSKDNSFTKRVFNKGSEKMH